MRRKLPKEIAEHQSGYNLAPSGAREPLLGVTIGLECITPVIGGGVRAREPDTVDIVRVPSIRGQLRFWWRAFGSEHDPATLFANEMRVHFGGIGGRTTRGFGALAPTAKISGLPSGWTQRFTRPGSSDAAAWLRSCPHHGTSYPRWICGYSIRSGTPISRRPTPSGRRSAMDLPSCGAAPTDPAYRLAISWS